jgi:hypothetical protein
MLLLSETTQYCERPLYVTERLYNKRINAMDISTGLGDFNIGGQVIQTVKYADDLVLMATEGKVLQGMIDKLIDIGRCYGMEMNVEKTKVMRISRQQSPVTIMIDQKTTGEGGMF